VSWQLQSKGEDGRSLGQMNGGRLLKVWLEMKARKIIFNTGQQEVQSKHITFDYM
jgi:hypothetical protein